jgi:hypothetical protein
MNLTSPSTIKRLSIGNEFGSVFLFKIQIPTDFSVKIHAILLSAVSFFYAQKPLAPMCLKALSGLAGDPPPENRRKSRPPDPDKVKKSLSPSP